MRRLLIVAMAVAVALSGGALPVQATESTGKGLPDIVDLKLATPRSMTYSPDRTRILVSASVGGVGGGRMIVLDAVTRAELSRVDVRESGQLYQSPRGDRLILRYPGGTLLLDPATGELLGQGPAGVHDLAFAPDGSRFYTTDSFTGTLTVYDSATLAELARVVAGKSALGIAVSPVGDRLYVAVQAAGNDPVLAVTIDAMTLQPIARSAVAVSGFCLDTVPTGSRVYAQTSDAIGLSALSVLDPTSLAVFASDTIAARSDCALVSPDGTRAYAYISGGGRDEYGPIAVVDTATMTTVGSIPTDTRTSLLGFSPDGRSLWLAQGYTLVRQDLSKVSSTLPAVDWYGDNAGLAALPGVQRMEARYAKVMSGPFVAGQWYSDGDFDDWYWDWTLVRRGGVTRMQTSRAVTYTSSTEVCTRVVTRKVPGAIDADRKARFRCTARTAETADDITRISAYRPLAYLHIADGSQEVVSAQDAAHSPTARKFTAWRYSLDYIGLRPNVGIEYTLRKDGGIDASWFERAGDETMDLLLEVSPRKVPKLPAMSSLKRGR